MLQQSRLMYMSDLASNTSDKSAVKSQRNCVNFHKQNNFIRPVEPMFDKEF